MAGGAKQILLLVVSLIIGIGVTFFSTGLMNEVGFIVDQQTQIIIAVVISLFAYVSFYFMSKGHGG
ncbi:MAG: hypothetical protein AB1324_07460 [Candidatus Micrarchaeota archaeon]